MFRRWFDRIAAYIGNLSLTAKGVLVVAFPVCALFAAMAIFFAFERQTQDAHYWVEHSWQVRSAIRRLRGRITNAEDATRGYVLTGRESDLDLYWPARRELNGLLDNLRLLVADNREQSQRLARVRRMAIDAMASLESVRLDAGARQVPKALAGLERARASTESARRELTDMESEEEQRLQARTVDEHQAQRRLEVAMFAGGISGLLGGVIAALLFSASIARRIRRLEQQARAAARGAPIELRVSGRDEIARLEQTFVEASQRLASQTEQLRAVQSELEHRVQQRTAELSVANEELRESNEMRQALIKSSPLAIWTMDLQGRVSFWSPAAERMFGWSAAEVIGKPAPIVPDDQGPEFEEWLERFRIGESIAGAERTRRTKDNKQIDVAIWTGPLRDASGAISGAIALDADITGRKLLEEQFRQSQKLEAVGRLAGGIAHDFNNLLTVIMGYVEMLIADSQQSPELAEYGQEILYAANRASSLTTQLLAFSRRQISQPKVLDLNEIVTHSTKLLRRVIGEDIEISTHLDPNLGRIKADPNHIDQVIMNLVVNARDAMSSGGKLTIETANMALDEEYAGRHIGVRAGAYSMLAISDTGTGMTADVKVRLFEPFFTTKEAGKGTGLGLSIVYGIVKQSGGEIMVYSEPDRGTTFKVYFPMAEAPAQIASAETRGAEMRGTETVLLCEDEQHIRRLVQTMLTKQGYRVLDAESPEQAIRVAASFPSRIDLLLTDIVMPKISGFELAQQISAVRPEIRVLYMSGYTDNRVSDSWVLDPRTAFLHKPFTASGLGQKVREALGTPIAQETRA